MLRSYYKNPIKMLLLEDEPADVYLIKRIFSQMAPMKIEPIEFTRLADALRYLETDRTDVILTDLDLPDSRGINTIESLLKNEQDIPLIVLTGNSDEYLPLEALGAGAQDYLIKGQIDANLLTRSIRYSLERHRLLRELRTISITDELTGLYNRRGFIMIAEKQLELALRVDKQLALFYLDIDGMKYVNDNYGHKTGDQAIIDTALILRKTFRKMDTIARIGGDEFAVMVLEDSSEEFRSILPRFNENVENFNQKADRPYKLSASMGISQCAQNSHCDITSMLADADQLMYRHKLTKKAQLLGSSTLPGSLSDSND